MSILMQITITLFTEKVFRKRTENGVEKKELDYTTEYTY